VPHTQGCAVNQLNKELVAHFGLPARIKFGSLE